MARVKLISRGIQEYLDGGHGVEALLQGKADAGAARAKVTAPVASGAYRDSIHVETVYTDRMRKHVVADVPYALQVEADTGNMARSL